MSMMMEESHLDEIEFLLDQSMNGIHRLFDNSTIARVLQKPTEELDFFRMDNLDRIQDLFTELIQKETVADKQLFLSSLNKEDHETLLRAYFHIVENTMLATSAFKH